MPTLPELQAGFAAAILREDARDVAASIVGDGLTPAARVQVYWNHVFSSLTEALEATFPVVCRLVDRRFFGFAADRYIRAHPPAGPCLFEYGESLPDFLAGFPPCADYPYLADVARLEWAMNVALHAEEAAPISPGGARAPCRPRRWAVSSSGWTPRRRGSGLALAGRPHLAREPARTPTRTSPWISTGGVDALEIRRQDDAVTMRAPRRPSSIAFRSRLGRGETLEAVAARALAEDPAFDLAAALRALLDEALITGFTLRAASRQASRHGGGGSAMTTAVHRGAVAEPRPGRGRLARPPGARAALAPPAPVPPGRRQRVPQGRADQGVQLGVHGRAVPGRVPACRCLPPELAATSRPRFELGVLDALILGLATRLATAPASRDDRDDPALRVPERVVRAPGLGIDPPVPADARPGAVSVDHLIARSVDGRRSSQRPAGRSVSVVALDQRRPRA